MKYYYEPSTGKVCADDGDQSLEFAGDKFTTFPGSAISYHKPQEIEEAQFRAVLRTTGMLAVYQAWKEARSTLIVGEITLRRSGDQVVIEYGGLTVSTWNRQGCAMAAQFLSKNSNVK